MAHRAGKASSKLGRSSNPKYLGVKLFDGQKVSPGNIIVRQRGTKIVPGKNTKRGRDDTIFAMKQGIIKFKTFRKKLFSGGTRIAKMVNVV